MRKPKVDEVWVSINGKKVSVKKVSSSHVHYRYLAGGLKFVRTIDHFLGRFEPT
jgi:hypothetical protein